jgi:anti-sigma regulatory factor (Ser/Thr protein kinase)
VCHTAVLDCGNDVGAPARGRHFVLHVLDACLGPEPDKSDERADVALVVTELLTNASRAARRNVRLELTIHRKWVRLAVTDDGDGSPQVRTAALSDTSGRGLSIVESIAQEWGVRMSDAPAGPSTKTVWALLTLGRPAPLRLLCDVD